jgi:hypothetical protein
MDLLNNKYEKKIYILFCLYSGLSSGVSIKTYFKNGKMESEGWLNQNQKSRLLVLLF